VQGQALILAASKDVDKDTRDKKTHEDHGDDEDSLDEFVRRSLFRHVGPVFLKWTGV
jgi:hypothetical protein